MSELPGDDEPKEGERGYSPYGLSGRQVGNYAVLLRDHIAASDEQHARSPDQAPLWDRVDRGTFGFLLALEESLPMLDDEVGDTSGQFPALVNFHASLPFTATEREWLVAKSGALWESEPKDVSHIQSDTFSVEQKIIELGAQQGIAGADMVRRWAAWRRNADEFTENSTREEAAYALDGLAHELLPYGHNPDAI